MCRWFAAKTSMWADLIVLSAPVLNQDLHWSKSMNQRGSIPDIMTGPNNGAGQSVPTPEPRPIAR